MRRAERAASAVVSVLLAAPLAGIAMRAGLSDRPLPPEAQPADIVLRPDAASFGSSNFDARHELIQSGYEAAQRNLPELKRRIERPAPPRKA
jgi:predicted acylesterase/phospholipase RssA